MIHLSCRVHYREPGALRLLSACGRKLTATLRLSPHPQQVTCCSCMTAMGWDGGPEARLMRAIFNLPTPAPRNRPRHKVRK